MDEQVPDWFENLDDAELDRRERARPGWRVWVILLSILIVLGLAVIPTLDLLDIGRGGSSGSGGELTEPQRVARSFSIAMLGTRSIDRAMELADAELLPTVTELIASLTDLDTAQQRDAQITIGSARCSNDVPTASECFHAGLRQADGVELFGIGFVVGSRSGQSRVTHLERLTPQMATR